MTENQSMPSPDEKSQAEGDREAVDREIEQQESGEGMPSSATVEQEVAGSD